MPLVRLLPYPIREWELGMKGRRTIPIRPLSPVHVPMLSVLLSPKGASSLYL